MDRFIRRRARPAASVAGLALALSACNAGSTTTEASDGTDVTVTLSEFAVDMSRVEFMANTDYTFTITNEGQVPHEFMILPRMTGMGEMDDMAMMDDMAVALVEADELPAGATVTRTFRLPGGDELEVACHVAGHYEAGMRLPVVVA